MWIFLKILITLIKFYFMKCCILLVYTQFNFRTSFRPVSLIYPKYINKLFERSWRSAVNCKFNIHEIQYWILINILSSRRLTCFVNQRYFHTQKLFCTEFGVVTRQFIYYFAYAGGDPKYLPFFYFLNDNLILNKPSSGSEFFDFFQVHGEATFSNPRHFYRVQAISRSLATFFCPS